MVTSNLLYVTNKIDERLIDVKFKTESNSIIFTVALNDTLDLTDHDKAKEIARVLVEKYRPESIEDGYPQALYQIDNQLINNSENCS
ncbi:hypothetical protein [Nitrosomonas sp.]|uniref:hypothetical protein n=1 Tax=Nitrosomonas sp. TaxID=42353 RepID=UPI0037C85373